MVYERFRSNIFYLIVCIVLVLGNELAYVMGISDDFMEVSYQYLFILLPVVLFILITKKSFKKTLRLNRVTSLQMVIAIILAVAAQPLTSLAAVVMQLLIGSGYSVIQEIDIVGSGNIIFSLFLFALTPAICEEVFMRGVVLDGHKKLPIWQVAILNGVLFGLFHNNFDQLSYATVFGIILAFVTIKTDSIYPAVVMHFIMNGLSTVNEFYPENLYARFCYLYESSALGLVIASVISLIAIIILIKWLSKTSESKIIDDDTELKQQEATVTPVQPVIAYPEWPLLLGTAISVVYSMLVQG
jgi:membrane protease YdiL (CAAX protease family)